MNINAINNVQFTGRLNAPVTLKNSTHEVNIINDYLIKSFKGENPCKTLEFEEIPLEGDKWHLTTVNNYSNGIKSKIFKERDKFHRMDCDLESGLYIGDFIINKDSAGEIDSVHFNGPIGNKSEVIVRDSKDLETLREAFKNYNEHIKAFYKKDYLERKPYPVRLLGY